MTGNLEALIKVKDTFDYINFSMCGKDINKANRGQTSGKYLHTTDKRRMPIIGQQHL